MADTIARYKQGKSILYYTWVPQWISGVLVEGKDVVWLTVPRTDLPGGKKTMSTLPLMVKKPWFRCRQCQSGY
ncbi:hypothetical protein ACFS4T_19245 [Pseudomonas lini]